jgi:hypothetical protein
MAKNVAGDPKVQLSRTDTGRTYNHSAKIQDTGNAKTTPFVDPHSGALGQPSKILTPEWEKASGNG